MKIYDYDVTFRSISPYVHGEFSPLEKLRVIAGLRYDDMQYDYDNNFRGGVAGATQGVAGGFPGRVLRARREHQGRLQSLGPKLGATYEFNKALSGFASYSNSFRTPSEGRFSGAVARAPQSARKPLPSRCST